MMQFLNIFLLQSIIVTSHLQFQVSLLDYSDYVGRIGIGRVFRGTMKVGQQVAVMKRDGTVKNFRVTKMSGFLGLKRVDIQEAFAGDLDCSIWNGEY